MAEEVRAAAARKRVTAASIARQLGMSQQALSRRWTGELPFDVDELYRVADILGIALGDLLPPTPTGVAGLTDGLPTRRKFAASRKSTTAPATFRTSLATVRAA